MRRALTIVALSIGSVLPFTSCSKTKPTAKDLVAAFRTAGPKGLLTIEYPFEGAMFPLEIAPSTITWKDRSSRANTWLIRIGHRSTPPLVEKFVAEEKWKPNDEEWETIKRAAVVEPISVTILGVEKSDLGKPISSAEVSIRASRDPVGAPIFFREVPLPFDFANRHPEKIRYRLEYAAKSARSKVVLENLPLCGNCHSFSRDGKVLGMDVDYANDKGSYVITELDETTDLTPNKIITWSDYKKEDKTLTFGLLSQVSPQGRYVVSTVKDRSIFVGIPENVAYSQLFFPVKGTLAVYDRQKSTFNALSGADDPAFVQSNPTWSPDGHTLFFARAKAYRASKVEEVKSAVLPREAAADFLEGRRKFRYDIYRMPFNAGEGGEVVPLKGAGNNGKSNYFPKVTPDGKWVVFAQSDSFMLLQPDSRLYIVPVDGGTPREMTCNTSHMNSWHSFSPNGRWMVFSSKERGPYTQLWLTHLDEQGNDTPPILLEHLITANMAANIPEFLNVAPRNLDKLVDQFSEGGNYHYRIAKNLVHYSDLEGALKALDRAAEQHPDSPDVFLERGALRFKMKATDLAILDFERSIAVAPTDYRGPFNLALTKEAVGDLKGAIDALDRAVELNDKNFEVLSKRASLKLKRADPKGAMGDLDKAIALNPNSARLFNLRGDLKRELGNFDGAMADFVRAIELDPDFGMVYLNRSYAHLIEGDLVSAKGDLEEAKKHAPNEPLGHVIEAILALKAGNSKGGCLQLEAVRAKGNANGYEDQIERLYTKMCR